MNSQNPFQPTVGFYEEASHLGCNANHFLEIINLLILNYDTLATFLISSWISTNIQLMTIKIKTSWTEYFSETCQTSKLELFSINTILKKLQIQFLKQPSLAKWLSFTKPLTVYSLDANNQVFVDYKWYWIFVFICNEKFWYKSSEQRIKFALLRLIRCQIGGVGKKVKIHD